MVIAGLARAMRVTAGDAQSLLNGHVAESVEQELGVVAFQIQLWIDTGTAGIDFAERLGMDTLVAEDLGMHLTKKGRIGLIFGMLIEH